MAEVLHGGRLDEAAVQYGGDPKKWLDLSTGINPNGYPVGELAPEIWNRLPDQAAHKSAMSAAREAYGVPDDAGVVLAPGAQMIIQNLPFLFKPQTVALVGFTYQEHGVCWRRADHEVYVTDGLESAEATARIVVLVNPNNPDGRIFDRGDLIALSRRLAAKGGLLVVDESFADAAPLSSVTSEAGRGGLFVIRSIGKFYGLGGLRFGVGLGAPAIIERLQDRFGPWAVSGPALAVAMQALTDKAWQKKTQKKLASAREDLEEMLVATGNEVVGGTSLFVLAKNPRGADLFEHLAKQHILVRRFVGKPDWLRFGMPGSKAGFNKLQKALDGFFVRS